MVRRLIPAGALVALAVLASSAPVAGEDPNDPDVRIRFYEQKLEQHPRLFAGFAELGAAYLDKARQTHDVTWTSKARRALERSLGIQPNRNASATMAALCNFLHRFECALEHVERAQTRPDDPETLSLKVEAYLGLGRLDDVARLLDGSVSPPSAPRGDSADSIIASAARGRWFAEQERYDEARDAFLDAAAKARAAKASDLAVWAETNAAGMLLDSGRPEGALAHLESASALPAGSRSIQNVLRIHWAEYHTLVGEPEKALTEYQALLAEQGDPEIIRRAFVLARTLGRTDRAEELFAAGERAARRIADAGEIFALETEARLYADADLNLDRAEPLARRNLEYKKDRSAHETLAYVRSRRELVER